MLNLWYQKIKMYDKYNIIFENKAKIEKIFKILFLIVIQMKSIALTSSYLPSASNSTVFLDSSYTRESFWGDLSTEHQGWFEISNVRFDPHHTYKNPNQNLTQIRSVILQFLTVIYTLVVPYVQWKPKMTVPPLFGRHQQLAKKRELIIVTISIKLQKLLSKTD